MLSIAEILKMDCFHDARAITDGDLSVPVVGSVTVGEVPDISQWLTGGEIVLTTLYAAKGEGAETFETVESIINSPAAALVVKLGRFVERLPEDIIKMANERRFPIISLPADVRWTTVIMEISRALSKHEFAKLTWLEAVRQQFARISAGVGGLSPIAKTLSGLIGCTVVIEDLMGCVLAHSLEPEPLPQAYGAAPMPGRVSNTSNRYRIEQNVSPGSYLYYAIASRKEPPIAKYAFEIDDGRDRCGYITVFANADDIASPIDEHQILAIEKAVEAANIEMSKMRASLEAEMRIMGNLFMLLNSGTLSHNEAVRRTSFLQIDIARGFIVCVADLVHVAEGAGSRTVEQIMEHAFMLARRAVSAYFPGSLIALDGRKVNMLLVPPPGLEPQRRSALVGSAIERIAQGLNDALPGAKFRIGASSFHTDAGEVNAAYSEATTAALISAATGRASGIGNFRELGLYKLLLRVHRSHPEDANKFYADTLGAVEEYDRKRDGTLLHTLELFFTSSENINETAAKLFTHRHTVRYRLQRIAELSGLDPLNPDSREILRIAIKLRQLNKLMQA